MGNRITIENAVNDIFDEQQRLTPIYFWRRCLNEIFFDKFDDVMSHKLESERLVTALQKCIEILKDA